MKKALALTLALLLSLACAGCGQEAPAKPGSESQTAASPLPVAEPAAPTTAPTPTEAPQPAEASAVPEVSSPDLTDPTEDAVALALSLLEHPVEELYAALGEPMEREYASSCLVIGGKDGILTYDGFTVYTLVSPDGTETVYDAE